MRGKVAGMVKRRELTVAVAVLALLGGGVPADAKKREKKPRKPVAASLAAFPTCKAMKRYAVRHRNALTAFPFTDEVADGGPRKKSASSPEQAAGDGDAGQSSGTNVQEQGVDEPDLVKSQGDRIYVVTNGRLVSMETGPGAPRELGSLDLGSKNNRVSGGSQLLLRGTRAYVLTGDYDALRILEVDISNPAAMRLTSSMTAEGHMIDARQHDGVARIAVQSSLDVAARSRKRSGRALRRTKPRRLLPKAKLTVAGRTSRQALVACGAVRKPGNFAGLDVMTVLTIDMDKGLPAVDSDAVMMSGETVYASPESLYVATQNFGSQGFGGPTEIHRFSFSGASTNYEASGSVTGTMLNQFSMSEYGGVLRVASTKESQRRRRDSQSYVTTLQQSGDRLVPLAQIGGLGRGERIYAVRFIDDTAYVVTFRQVDPLYTIDLSNPSAPAVLGELKVRGYSAYLHPDGTDRLIGVGQDATPDGFARGTQVSLFDVSNLSAPGLLSKAKLGGDSHSDVEFDHRAFLFWEPKSLVVIPASIYPRNGVRPSFDGAVAFSLAGGVHEVGRIEHGPNPPPIARAVVNSGRLVTVSDRGVLVSDIDSLAPVGWVPLQ